MGKKKRARFRELETLERVFQPSFEEVFRKDHAWKGQWKKEAFGNDYPLILELGCGKGEYTVGLARMHPEINYMGIDIKGARIWKGARLAEDEGMKNVAFLRTRIDFIESFFGPEEVDELWITFPDPQDKKRRRKKRLVGAQFLNRYRMILKDRGRIHLKTDNGNLYGDTLDLVNANHLPLERKTRDLYRENWKEESTLIQTYYESRFISEGKPIHYLCFRLPSGQPVKQPAHDGE